MRRFSILDPRFSILDSRFSILDPRSSAIDAVTFLRDPERMKARHVYCARSQYELFPEVGRESTEKTEITEQTERVEIFEIFRLFPDVGTHLQSQLLSSKGEVETKKAKRAKKAKTLGFFALFVLFAFFASSLPFAMRPDFRNVS